MTIRLGCVAVVLWCVVIWIVLVWGIVEVLS
jgi:hypothetical protein